MSTLLLVFAVAAVAAAVCTGVVRRFALAASVLDIPNDRSSHTTPTPRGGGLAIVAAVTAGILAGWALGQIPQDFVIALIPGALLLAGVSWLDDRGGVPVTVRLVAQLAAAGWVVYSVGPIDLGVPAFSTIVSLLLIVWTANLFNFMDGIDGIAAGQALAVGGALTAIFAMAGASWLAWVAVLIAGSAAGFLVWNWAPARIFMGDVGSVFLGFLLAALGVLGARGQALRPSGWAVLMALFLADATLTLVRRVLRGERWSQAHKSHAYQRAVQAGWSARAVTATVVGADLVLAGLVLLATRSPALWPAAWVGGAVMALALYLAVERARPM